MPAGRVGVVVGDDEVELPPASREAMTSPSVGRVARPSRNAPRAARLLPRTAKAPQTACMPTMNVSLPESLRAFVAEQIAQRR